MPLTTYTFDSSVRAFSTQRGGGVSEGTYESFNINPYCGDRAASIRANRALLCAELGISDDRLLLPHQTHGTETAVVCSFMDNGVEADAVITQERRLCIGVSTADCVPILLYDPVTKTIAAIHAGWRGTVNKIVEKCLHRLQAEFNVCPADLRAAIGPCISLKNFEVGDEVYAAFVAAGFPMPVLSVRMRKWHIDLPKANLHLLAECGVRRPNVFLSQLCTYDLYETYFSARRLTIQSGRIYTGIMLL